MSARYELSLIVQKTLREKNLTADEVIRKALNIKPEGFDAGEGVFLAEGTAFMAWYKERPHWGVVTDGAMVIEGKAYQSVSAAAAAVTGRPTTNGWDFWMIKNPGKNEFVPIKSLRK